MAFKSYALLIMSLFFVSCNEKEELTTIRQPTCFEIILPVTLTFDNKGIDTINTSWKYQVFFECMICKPVCPPCCSYGIFSNLDTLNAQSKIEKGFTSSTFPSFEFHFEDTTISFSFNPDIHFFELTPRPNSIKIEMIVEDDKTILGTWIAN